MKDKKQLSK